MKKKSKLIQKNNPERVEDEFQKILESEKILADVIREAPIAIAFGYPDGRLEL